MKWTNMYRRLILLIFTISLGLSWPPVPAQANDYKFFKKYGHRDRDWNQDVRAGFEAYDSQDCNQTLTYLKQAVSKQCHDGLVYFKLAVCSEAMGSAYTALQYYELSKEKLKLLKKPHRYKREIYLNYGRALFRSNQDDKAFDVLSKAHALGSRSFGLYYLLGVLSTKKNDSKAAVRYFNQALSQDHSSTPPKLLASVYKEVAKAHLLQKNYQEALKLLEIANKLAPNNSEIIQMKSKASHAIRQKQVIEMIEQLSN